MRTIEAIRRSAVAVGPAETIHAAAQVMERAGVGSLAVVDDDGVLLGIVTDRDLVRRGLAKGLAPDARVDGCMTSPVVSVDADADLHEVYEVFRSNAVRRLALTRDGRFAGMLSLDDLLVNLAADLSDLVRPITAEVLFGHRDSSVPAPAT